jgi:hypothetical protein
MNQKRQSDQQPARDALPSAIGARGKHPQRAAEHKLQRWALSGVGALGFGALFVLAGCPGNLDNPQRFETSSAAGMSSTAGTSSTDPNVLPMCVAALFKDPNGACAGLGCHSAGPNAAGGLDLTSPGVVSRLLNQPATHADVPDAGGVSCPSVKLIDSSNPQASWMLTKVQSNYSVPCGAEMPLGGGALASSDQNCLAMWVQSFGPAPGTSAGGGSGGAAPGGAPAGGAATSGGAPAGGSASSNSAGKSGGGSGGASASAGTGGA